MTIELGSTKLHYPSFKWSSGVNLILGPSGVGKTTLLRAIHGDLNEGGAEQFKSRYRTSFMPQQPIWISYLTMREHFVEVELKRELLERVGLLGQEKKLPHQLSVGQSQRFWLLWALLEKAPLTLLDEPTSALDDDWAVACMQLIQDFIQEQPDRQVFIVTHDLRLINRFKDHNTVVL